MHSERAPLFLKVAAWGGVIFLHFPLLIIATYAFNTEDAAFSFPPQGLTLKWFSVAAGRGDIIDSVTLSLQIAALSPAIALVLGTLAAARLRLLRDLCRCGSPSFPAGLGENISSGSLVISGPALPMPDLTICSKFGNFKSG